MNEPTLSRRVTVVNDQGLHLRPLDMFVRCASDFDAEIQVVKGDVRADGKSILSLLTLVAKAGSQLLIEATGHDAEEALAALVDLVESGFVEEGLADTMETATAATDTVELDTSRRDTDVLDMTQAKSEVSDTQADTEVADTEQGR
jgi:phosphotransferase system HPr (HPr) family protein